MKIQTQFFGGIPLIQNPEWNERGILHGFLGRDFDGKSELAAIDVFLRELAGERRPLHLLRQTHSAVIQDITALAEAAEGGPTPEGDGWFLSSQSSGNIFGVLTADCFPVLLLAKELPLAAVLHCGWRSTVKAILPDAVQRFLEAGVQPERVEMFVGPGAQACCYEVSSSFSAEAARDSQAGNRPFQPKDLPLLSRDGRVFADIQALLRAQAQAVGIPAGNISSCAECTICADRFFSHRREKAQAGRQLSFIGL